MNEEEKKIKEKVVLFPGVVEKLVVKGMDALKEKQLTDALAYFEQALEIEPNHSQGRFGVALSLIEQSRLEEAKEVTEKMLREDIGNYYDILQVHLSLLVQLGYYDEVVAMLEGIIAEEKLPANLAESFYHLLHFSRQMTEDGNKVEIDHEHEKVSDELLQMLYEGTPEKQWLAIQMLRKAPSEQLLKAVKNFLISEHHDPVLKSMILQQLKEKDVKDKIEIHKFGKRIVVNLAQLEDVFHEKFGKNTLEQVAKQLENENPSLFEMISQLWWHYLFAIYPITPEPFSPTSWAAAIHFVGCQYSGIDCNEEEIASIYNVAIDELFVCTKEIYEIEKGTYKN